MEASDYNSWRYRLMKNYLKFMHEQLLVRRRYTTGMEKLPKKGERYFIVCNHQNTANDPLNIVFSLPQRQHVCALARANVFSVNPVFTRFLYWIGLLPAFRFGWEGAEGLENNFESFDIVAERINAGFPVIVFPEAGHTQGHYLDRFTTGTVRMAFHAAKTNGWQEDVKIVPTAHHYSDYFDIRTDFLWSIGDPISLKPYYKDYQEHPNSVMRNLTQEIRDCIQHMMLDEGSDDYEEKDYLRCSALNPATLKRLPLTEHLEADRQFISQLNENPEKATILQLTAKLRKLEQKVGTDDITVAQRPGWLKTGLWMILLLVLLPCWIVSLWPHAICYSLPPRLIHKDKMFTNSYRYIMSVLLLYPLFALLTLLVMGIGWGLWWQALVWVLLWVPLGKYAWWYYQRLRQTKRALCYLLKPGCIKEIEGVRREILLRVKSL